MKKFACGLICILLTFALTSCDLEAFDDIMNGVIADEVIDLGGSIEQGDAELDGKITKKSGIYSDGDIIYAEVSPELEQFAEHFVEVDGHRLCPIVKYYKVPEDIAKAGKQRIIF